MLALIWPSLIAELTRIHRPVLTMDQSIDTLAMARKKFPGAQANLDALCRRFKIDNTHRNLHGALLDADLLASIYIELLGGRQPGLLDADQSSKIKTSQDEAFEDMRFQIDAKNIRPIRLMRQQMMNCQLMQSLLHVLKDPVWNQ